MTEAEKKAIYDREYVKSLEWHKNAFSNYEHYLKIPLKERWEILEHFKQIFAIMKKCGICRFDGEEPMSNVSDFLVKFNKKGDPDSLDDLLISNHESCWSTVKFERTPEEIEAAAKSSAKMEVDLAEYREKKALEEVEEKRKAEEWKAKQEAAQEKNRQELNKFFAKRRDEEEEMKSWFRQLENELNTMRHSAHKWFAEEHLSKEEVEAVKQYADTLFSFTSAQNNGLTGFGLYAQNCARTEAHEKMLEVFGLTNDAYAMYATKSYDYSDDYDYKLQQYKHLDKDKVVDMLGYALAETKKVRDLKKNKESS